MGDSIRIETLADQDDAGVRALLVDLAMEEQDKYDHPRQTRAQVEQGMPPLRSSFTGENRVFVARSQAGEAVGVCWCVLFDPGTGLEGEVAELYVDPQWRGQGLANMLLGEAMSLFRSRQVTFACVWTRNDNPAALAAYRRAGFGETEQKVLSWLPL